MLGERRQVGLGCNPRNRFRDGLPDGLPRLFAGVGKRAATAAPPRWTSAEFKGNPFVLGVERLGAIEIFRVARAVALRRDLLEPRHQLDAGFPVEDGIFQLELGRGRYLPGSAGDQLFRVDGSPIRMSILHEQRDIPQASAVFDDSRAAAVADFPVLTPERQDIRRFSHAGWRQGRRRGHDRLNCRLRDRRLWRNSSRYLAGSGGSGDDGAPDVRRQLFLRQRPGAPQGSWFWRSREA